MWFYIPPFDLLPVKQRMDLLALFFGWSLEWERERIRESASDSESVKSEASKKFFRVTDELYVLEQYISGMYFQPGMYFQ